jgi:hypothetical protein
MKAKMILAEAATPHPDGTISMLRAGITHVWGSQPPFTFEGCLVIRVEAELTDHGPHNFDVNCLDEDGRPMMPALKGQFEVPHGGGVSNIILGMGLGFPKAGRFTFCVRIDNVDHDRWTLSIAERTQKKEKSEKEESE